MIGGKWTYRSFLNEIAIIGDDAAAALALIFGEGVFDLAQDGDTVSGALGMGADYALTLSGTVEPSAADGGLAFALIGLGVDGTPTAGWRYDYRGSAGYNWPDGVDQIPSLVGTVVRVNAHGPHAPAGVTASFVAVRHPDDPAPRTLRQNILLS